MMSLIDILPNLEISDYGIGIIPVFVILVVTYYLLLHHTIKKMRQDARSRLEKYKMLDRLPGLAFIKKRHCLHVRIPFKNEIQICDKCGMKFIRGQWIGISIPFIIKEDGTV